MSNPMVCGVPAVWVNIDLANGRTVQIDVRNKLASDIPRIGSVMDGSKIVGIRPITEQMMREMFAGGRREAA